MGGSRDYDAIAATLDEEHAASELPPLEAYEKEPAAANGAGHLNGKHAAPARSIASVEPQSLEQILASPEAGRDWFFEDIMPAGCFLVVGRPKIGKSWLLLQLAITAASCGNFLGFSALGSFGVLYVAAEDDPARIKSRFQMYRSEAPAGIKFILRNDLDELANEYCEQYSFAQFLDQWLEAHPKVRVVIIDTESTVRAVWDSSRRSTEPSATRKDYTEVREFDSIAIRRRAFIALVNHTSKRKSNVWFDIHELINRTNTAMAGASGSYVLADPPGSDPNDSEKTVRVLGVRGRDIQGEHLIAVQQDEFAVFKSLGKYNEHRQTEAETEVLNALEEMHEDGGEEWRTAAEIAQWTGKKAGSVQRLVSRMIKNGKSTWKGYRIETKRKVGIRLMSVK